MAEISYPFAADSAGGGTKTVSQIEWQRMSQIWSDDRIDFQLTNSTYSSAGLPFHTVLSGANLVTQAGSAWVGGFYYRNTAALSKPAPTNSGSLPRVDRIVLRCDMATGSVNLAIKTGTPAASPVPPPLERTPGGTWEMGLWLFNLAANNGARTLTDARSFRSPERVHAPWNTPTVTESLPSGAFVTDMDSDGNASQWEAFNGRDGYVVTRHLGKALAYTPNLINNASSPAAAKRVGRWRWVAPNSYHVSVNIENDAVRNVSGGSVIGVTLPVAAAKPNYQHLQGVILNPSSNNGMPNMMSVLVRITPGTTNAYLYMPNWTSLAAGLDSLQTIPANSRVEFSGVIEANQFNE
ncbi:hypothetical protein AB0D68_10850 [Streptomyces sp. NPDC048212]|uniref:hypothetical protein n=1 Tax=Streptomyces sp. NPDC048212 TaxID=3156658 RepID=UPI0033FF96A7